MELQESMCTNAGDGADIEVSAFGTPEVRIDDESVTDLLPEKAIALLVYLADSSEPIGRSSLAGLLWSDSTEDRARNSLRVLLTRTRSVLGDALVADRNAVGFSPSSYDVVERAAADPLSRAELYVADFLDGFEPANASLFSTWAQARRARLRAQAVTDLDAHTVEAARQGDWARCRELASLTLSIDPWSEPAHRAMIESLARTVGRSQALAHYDDFARSLQSELGVLPEPDTTELVAATGVRSPAAEPADRVPLPTRPTPFFGRSAELRRLDELVAPARPVSIVGPGGIGKSRLLAEYASRRARRGDDVTFVGFDADTADLPPDASRTLAEGVLDVLGHTADGQRSAVESLHRSLEGRRGVLCLDDLDALGDVSAVVAELAAGCPGLEVVVASRRRLAITTGHVVALGGLVAENGDDEAHPGVELFLESARHLDATCAERTTVVDICQQLDGHPLAIELAAHLSATTPIHDVADRIERTADLAAPGSDLADRHQSLHELVRASTTELGAPAASMLGHLVCFVGPFSRADAGVVAGGADHLDELIEHSLVQFDGRDYRIHAVIRDSVRAGLTDAELRTGHARHAQRMLELCATGAWSGRLRVELQGRHDDLRRAAGWRIADGPAAGLVEDLRPYLAHQRSWGWVASTLETARTALARTDLPAAARAELHRHGAEALLHRGDRPDAERELQAGLAALGHQLHDRPGRRARATASSLGALAGDRLRRDHTGAEQAAELSRLMSLYGELLYVTDRRAEMASYASGAVLAGRRSGDDTLIGAGDVAVGIAAQLAGAGPLSRQAVRRGRRRVMGPTTDPFTASLSRATCALIAASAGEFAQARSDGAAAIDAAREAGRPRHVVLTELLLALVAFHEQSYDEVVDRLDDTAARIDRIGYRPAMTWVHTTRAETSLRTGGDARDEADQALRSGEVHGAAEDVGRARIALAGCVIDDDPERATELVRSARAALERPGSIALQHCEAICRSAELSVALGARGSMSPDEVERSTSRLRRVGRSIPLVTPRLQALLAAGS